MKKEIKDNKTQKIINIKDFLEKQNKEEDRKIIMGILKRIEHLKN